MLTDDQMQGGLSPEEEENLDLIEGVDEDGNTVLLEVIRYFFYNGEEYVVLGDAHEEEAHECSGECGGCSCHSEEDEDSINLYIMKVVQSEEDGEEIEEFTPVEDQDLLDQLIEVVQADFDSDEEIED